MIELTERLIKICLNSGASIRPQSVRRGTSLAPDGAIAANPYPGRVALPPLKSAAAFAVNFLCSLASLCE